MIFQRRRNKSRRNKRGSKPIDYHQIGQGQDYRFDVVGEKYRQRELQTVANRGRRHAVHTHSGTTMVGTLFWLVPDPDNSHDPNAVGVWAGNRESPHLQVGWIPAVLAQEMAPRIEQPVPIRGMVIGKSGGYYGVRLDQEQMQEAGVSPWQTWIDEPPGPEALPDHDGTVFRSGRFEHWPDHPDGPNTVGVRLDDTGYEVGTVRGTEKLWGPNVDDLPVSVRIRRGSTTKVSAYLPDDAHDATGWECGPHCATVGRSLARDGSRRWQATGRLVHLRFKVPTCEQARAGFREAKKRNADEAGTRPEADG